MDTVIVAFEVMHSIRRKVGKKGGLMGIKLYISKACDRIEWTFLKGVMRKIGFND